MKKFEIPAMTVEYIEVLDVITTSNGGCEIDCPDFSCDGDLGLG